MGSPLPPDPYKALGVTKNASLQEIRRAHRKLVLQVHPDKCPDDALKAQKMEQFQRIQLAYELLSDERQRNRYDDRVKLAELRDEILARTQMPAAGYNNLRTPATPVYEQRSSRAYEERRSPRHERKSSGSSVRPLPEFSFGTGYEDYEPSPASYWRPRYHWARENNGAEKNSEQDLRRSAQAQPDTGQSPLKEYKSHPYQGYLDNPTIATFRKPSDRTQGLETVPSITQDRCEATFKNTVSVPQHTSTPTGVRSEQKQQLGAKLPGPNSQAACDVDNPLKRELDQKWTVNQSMHFNDNSAREKFFITYTETPSRWRRVTVSCDYRNPEANSLESDLKSLHSQQDKSAAIYEAIRDYLSDIRFYDTVTNLKLETSEGRLHVHVTEDVSEIIPYPSIKAVSHLGLPSIPLSWVHLHGPHKGFVYRVRVDTKTYLFKAIPGPDQVKNFMFDLNRRCLGLSNSIAGVVVDEMKGVLQGFLIPQNASQMILEPTTSGPNSEVASKAEVSNFGANCLSAGEPLRPDKTVKRDFPVVDNHKLWGLQEPPIHCNYGAPPVERHALERERLENERLENMCVGKVAKRKRGLSGFMNGKRKSAMADTGAGHNIVSAAFIADEGLTITGTSAVLRLGNSRKIKSLGMF